MRSILEEENVSRALKFKSCYEMFCVLLNYCTTPIFCGKEIQVPLKETRKRIQALAGTQYFSTQVQKLTH